MNAAAQFSVKGAKVLAGAVARFGTGWLVAKAVAWGFLSATWAADPQHLLTVALIVAGIVYELEEAVWRRWGWDIPAALARVGVPLMEGTAQSVVAPAPILTGIPANTARVPTTLPIDDGPPVCISGGYAPILIATPPNISDVPAGYQNPMGPLSKFNNPPPEHPKA
jgi:hypothetical protein